MSYRQEQGKSGEDAAAGFFIENGFTILERNVRCGRYGELDLVLSQGDIVVFAEVKKRNNKAFGGAVYSISRKKLASLRRNAEWYIANRGLQGKMFRFDLIAIDDGVITWVQDILH
ncbi:MAG: YraN family protein [Leptospirales bacterium]|nr:YraN family protein [Leptospirales bacterium]